MMFAKSHYSRGSVRYCYILLTLYNLKKKKVAASDCLTLGEKKSTSAAEDDS